eukprot:5228187-Pyramimonas_sp.AAC.1
MSTNAWPYNTRSVSTASYVAPLAPPTARFASEDIPLSGHDMQARGRDLQACRLLLSARAVRAEAPLRAA